MRVTPRAIAPLLLILCFDRSLFGEPNLIRFQAPPTLSFDELVSLAAADPPPPDLQKRLDALLSTPFISNEASYAGARPNRITLPRSGPVIRIAEWNINRLDKEPMRAAFANLEAYQAEIGANPKLSRKARNRALEQARNLEGANIVVLDEIDDGVPRSRYDNVPRQLAQALHINYVYGIEFIELNSIYLGVKGMYVRQQPAQTGERFGVDAKRYLGLEGTALLSRYPILKATILHLPKEYDWYHGEIGAIGELRKAERWTAEKIFDEQLKRQVRRGGRIMLVVELAVPGLSAPLTIVCPHLEDYTSPAGRREQMDFVLKHIAGISGPLVVAGDLNTLGHNGAPLTLKRTLRRTLVSVRFWFKQIFYFIEPIPGLHYVLLATNYVKNYHDPTAFNFPLFLPNRSEPLFENIHQFRFQDGEQFDWAGEKDASFHHRGRTLSVTNQRAWKGFATTFSFRRTYHGLVGEYKIDWMLVKQPAPSADPNPNFPLRPYFGRALCDLNKAPSDRISDHCPITLDLALPQLRRAATGIEFPDSR